MIFRFLTVSPGPRLRFPVTSTGPRRRLSNATGAPRPAQPAAPERATRRSRGSLARVASRAAALCLLVCLTSGAASAYTIVMRGGRRVEVPDAFRVSRTTLTYEAAPGINITLPLDHIDVEATERANSEPAGSFLRRAQVAATGQDAAARHAAQAATTRQTGRDAATGQGAPAPPATGSVAPRAAVRTLTNRDLEPARRARVESELKYERRREELGLPSAEEMRRRDEREAEFMHELAQRKAAEDAEFESYRRALAAGLLTDLSALDAENDYLRRRLSEQQLDGSAGYFTSGGVAIIAGGWPFGGRRIFAPTLRTRPSFRESPFAPLHPANLGARGLFGGRHGGRGPRVGASVGVGVRGVVGGTRAGVRPVRRGSPGRFSRRK
jgi:hypothetical protein